MLIINQLEIIQDILHSNKIKAFKPESILKTGTMGVHNLRMKRNKIIQWAKNLHNLNSKQLSFINNKTTNVILTFI